MLDFDAEAKRLRAALGLDTANPGAKHHDMDKMWVDKRTGGAVYVGNETAAKMSREQFAHYNIVGVVSAPTHHLVLNALMLSRSSAKNRESACTSTLLIAASIFTMRAISASTSPR